jgi:hypothetical protein
VLAVRIRDGRRDDHHPGEGRASGRYFRPAPPQTTDEWVNVSTVMGSALVPKEVARLLHDVVMAMLEDGDITEGNRWQVFELLAADYLAGRGA